MSELIRERTYHVLGRFETFRLPDGWYARDAARRYLPFETRRFPCIGPRPTEADAIHRAREALIKAGEDPYYDGD